LLFRKPLRFLAAAAALWAAAAATPPVTIRLDNGAFRVDGWKPPRTPPAKGWAELFTVFAGSGNVPPMLGSYAVEGGALVFRPKFPLAEGVRYRAVFHPVDGAPVESSFDGPPKQTAPVARVEAVYPSADVLPTNLLRLYIYFSAPMSEGEAGRRVHLLEANGKEQRDVFLPGEELWDPQFRRLTMTLDPGRIKRGLTSNMAMGAPIVEGRSYTLMIDREWPDARNVPMLAAFRKSFRGGAAERAKPNPARWRVTPPAAGSSAALTLEFPKPMNYVLLGRMIEVVRENRRMEGSVAVDRNETRWLFTPREPWNPGDYRLSIDNGLEDLAGNSLAQAFDIDVFERVTERMVSSKTSLAFRVSAAGH
jgi:hypothetical protein